MLTALGQVLPQAFGIMITPYAIIMIILMLVSARAKATAPAFVAGWMLGVAAITTVALVLADGADASTDNTTKDGINVFKLAFGVVFALLAVRTWRSRPRDGATKQPKIFSIVDSLPWIKAAGLGFGLGMIPPKT